MGQSELKYFMVRLPVTLNFKNTSDNLYLQNSQYDVGESVRAMRKGCQAGVASGHWHHHCSYKRTLRLNKYKYKKEREKERGKAMKIVKSVCDGKLYRKKRLKTFLPETRWRREPQPRCTWRKIATLCHTCNMSPGTIRTCLLISFWGPS